jgi:N4-gp56 family major capsid protein
MGQQWAINSLGGFFSNNVLSKRIRHSAQPLMKFRQFVDAEPAAGRSRGDMVLFDKISNISTAGGTLNETATIPKNNFTIRQGTLTVTEYGNSVPHTLKVQTLSEISVPESIRTVLRNDMAKVLDSDAAIQYQSAKIKAVATNTASTIITSDGTATATASANMSDKNVRDVIDQLKKEFVPRFDGSNYICIGSVNSIRGLYDFFETKVQQSTVITDHFNGEIGMYYGCRFVEETNRLSDALGSGTTFGEAIFFGGDAVREGIVIPENLRIDIPKDFGRDQGIAWFALTGFVKTWDKVSDGEARIIHLTSA